jgi:CheY-like chemotaxis protein
MKNTKCNLLIVEDDDVAAESIQRSLAKAGLPFTAIIAGDGLEALHILRGQHPTKKVINPLIVLLDLNMPIMDGFEFLQAIRNDQALRSVVVFVLTTSSSDLDRAKAYNENIAGYMVKNNVGAHFSKLFELLSDYVEAVELPILQISK